ncbi:MAG: hypothetical protein JXQ90_21920 [Cyclobacteriaceae bacterium]
MKNVCLLAILWICACSHEQPELDDLRTIDFEDTVTQIDELGSYSRADAVQFLNLINPISSISTTCGFTLFRIHYWTHDHADKRVLVSGLMAIPDADQIKGVVSYQHGTMTYRGNSISNPSPGEGIGIASLFAANAYLLVAPDYIGLGISEEIHPYYHVPSTVNAIVDLIRVGARVSHYYEGRPNLFLTGFSQGGGASLAAHRYLQGNNETGLSITACAPIAGAYNLSEISLPYGIEQHSSNMLVYLSYLSLAYSEIYQVELSEFIQPPFNTELPIWLDGNHQPDFLKDHLPKQTTDLFKPEFVAMIRSGEDFWFTQMLEENEMYRWVPERPVRLFYGENDIDVIPAESESAYEYMYQNGGNVELANLGPYDHEESILLALPLIQQWFDTF